MRRIVSEETFPPNEGAIPHARKGARKGRELVEGKRQARKSMSSFGKKRRRGSAGTLIGHNVRYEKV